MENISPEYLFAWLKDRCLKDLYCISNPRKLVIIFFDTATSEKIVYKMRFLKEYPEIHSIFNKLTKKLGKKKLKLESDMLKDWLYELS